MFGGIMKLHTALTIAGTDHLAVVLVLWLI